MCDAGEQLIGSQQRDPAVQMLEARRSGTHIHKRPAHHPAGLLGVAQSLTHQIQSQIAVWAAPEVSDLGVATAKKMLAAAGSQIVESSVLAAAVVADEW